MKNVMIAENKIEKGYVAFSEGSVDNPSLLLVKPYPGYS